MAQDWAPARCCCSAKLSQPWSYPQIKLLEREMDGSKLLVFCETKRGCDTVTRQLRQDGWPALAIHGDKSQQERDWVLAVRSPTLLPRPATSRGASFSHGASF